MIRGGAITLNDELIETRPLGLTFQDDSGRLLDVYEQAVGSRSWLILDDPNVALLPDLPPTTVPDGRYFVLGDNRDHSKDSRFWGTVAREDLIGPAIGIYWSWDFNGTWAELLNPLRWMDLLSHRTRWDRIGRAIDSAGAPSAARSFGGEPVPVEEPEASLPEKRLEDDRKDQEAEAARSEELLRAIREQEEAIRQLEEVSPRGEQ